MTKEVQGKTATKAKTGGKKEIETPVQGSPTWNLLGAMAIGMGLIMVFGIGYLIGAKSLTKPGVNSAVVSVSEELARVTVTGGEDGEWEFAIADGSVIEYAGRDEKAVYVTEDEETDTEDEDKETVSADVTADLSDDDYKGASGGTSSAEGYRRVYYFRGLNKGETTVTMSYRENGKITKTKSYIVNVDENLKATIEE